MTINTILANGISTIISGLLIVASYFIIKNAGREKFDFWVEIAVLGAEQLCKYKTGKEVNEYKKELVIEFLKDQGFKHDEKMDMAIEAHVQRMNIVKDKISIMEV